MMALSGLVLLSVLSLIAAAPTSEETSSDTLYITPEFYNKEYVKYHGEHDIVNLVVPLNSINFEDKDNLKTQDSEDADIIVFFVEADITTEGKRIDQGLYMLQKEKATKILANGRDVAVPGGNSKTAFLAASDGIYVYENGITVKYGTLTDNLIGITMAETGLYILTENHEVYNVTDKGNTKTKIESIPNAQQIILDYSYNLYFYSDDKKAKVLTKEGVKTITGLPENCTSVTLIKAPFILEDGVMFVVDDTVYALYANATSKRAEVEFKPNSKPSAYAPEAALIQYFALDKKIYELNLLAMLSSTDLEDLNNFFGERADAIKKVQTKPKTVGQ